MGGGRETEWREGECEDKSLLHNDYSAQAFPVTWSVGIRITDGQWSQSESSADGRRRGSGRRRRKKKKRQTGPQVQLTEDENKQRLFQGEDGGRSEQREDTNSSDWLGICRPSVASILVVGIWSTSSGLTLMEWSQECRSRQRRAKMKTRVALQNLW